MVKGEDSQLSGCGFESQSRILDGLSEASYYIGKRNKGSQMGHIKKMFKKTFLKTQFLLFSGNVVTSGSCGWKPTRWNDLDCKLMKARTVPRVLAVAPGGPRKHPEPGVGSRSDASEEEGGTGRHWPHLALSLHSLQSTPSTDNIVSKNLKNWFILFGFPNLT